MAAKVARRIPGVKLYMVGGTEPGFERWRPRATPSPPPVDDESRGREMLYSSGTTGRPKGVRMRLTPAPPAIDAPATP